MINEAACGRIVSAILDAEGGIADVGDGEGTTRFGQTENWLSAWGFPSPHTREEAAVNYRAWMAITRLDELTGINEPLAGLVIDSAVNEGLSYAVRTLQGAVGAVQDGVIGGGTISATTHADAKRISYRILKARLDHYVQLAKGDPTRNLAYLHGWTNRLFEQFLNVAGITL